jgi:ABC-type Fe3+ transport system permease subunit
VKDPRNRKLFLSLFAVAVLLGVVVSQFASSEPDGLEYVAEQEGFANTAEDHTLGDAPLADYGDNLSGNSTLNTAVAGFVGVIVTLAIGYGVFWIVRRRSPDDRGAAPSR